MLLTSSILGKAALQPTFNLAKESVADKAFQNTLEILLIDHRLQERVQNDDSSKTTAQFQKFLRPDLASRCVPGPMPLLTRQGFFDLTNYDIQCDPSKEWGRWRCVLKKYNLPRYRGWGDLPRAAFPDLPDQELIDATKQLVQLWQQKQLSG
jgi:hypothetical protein